METEKEHPKKKRGTFVPGLVFGVILGVVGALLLPGWVGTLLPGLFRESGVFEGKIILKELKANELLLKISSEEGVALATFFEKREQIDRLVDEGDLVILDVSQYEPFITEPSIARVVKPELIEAPGESESPLADERPEEEAMIQPKQEDSSQWLTFQGTAQRHGDSYRLAAAGAGRTVEVGEADIRGRGDSVEIRLGAKVRCAWTETEPKDVGASIGESADCPGGTAYCLGGVLFCGLSDCGDEDSVVGPCVSTALADNSRP